MGDLLTRLGKHMEAALDKARNEQAGAWELVAQLEEKAEDFNELRERLPKTQALEPTAVLYKNLSEIFGVAAGRAVFALVEYAIATLDTERHEARDRKAQLVAVRQPKPLIPVFTPDREGNIH